MWDRAEWAGGSSERDSEPLPWECWTCGAEFVDGDAADEHRESRDHTVVSGPVPRP
jgi:hypothetical protein